MTEVANLLHEPPTFFIVAVGIFVLAAVAYYHFVSVPRITRNRRRAREWHTVRGTVVDFAATPGTDRLTPLVEFAATADPHGADPRQGAPVRHLVPSLSPTGLVTGNTVDLLVNPSNPHEVVVPGEQSYFGPSFRPVLFALVPLLGILLFRIVSDLLGLRSAGGGSGDGSVNTIIVGAVLGLVLPILFVGVILFSVLSKSRKPESADWIITRGQIVDWVHRNGGHDHSMSYPVVAFTTQDGRRVVAEAQSSIDVGIYTTGKVIDITYHRQDPTKVRRVMF